VTSAEILETEWQYDAPDLGVLKRWFTDNARSGPLRVLPGESRRIHDLYLDTSDFRFLRAGYALRIRRTAKSAEASMKELAPRIGSLAVRREITKPLASGQMAALFEGQDPVAERLRLLCREEELKPLGRIRTLRQVYRIANGAEDRAQSNEARIPTAEIALDRSFLTDSLGHVHRLSRLEIEVSHEDVQAFRALAERLCDECSLRAAEQSKFEWAMRVNAIRVDRTMSLGSVEIERSMSVGQVADAVLRKHLAAFLWHEPGTRLGDDLEDLHRMRVACRRLRAALKLFCIAYPGGEPDRLRSQLREFGRRLGEVRDLDVFIEEIGSLRGRLLSVDPAACAPLLLHLAAERRRARERMRESLDSPDFEALKQDLARLLREGPPVDLPEGDASITQFGPQVIRRAHSRVVRMGRRLTLESPAEQYHELRIRAKRLRYIIEFLEDIYGAPAKELIAVLVEIQDLLGLHQDAWMSIHKLRTIASEIPAGFTPEGWAAVGELSQLYYSHAEDLRRGLRRILRRMERQHWPTLKRSMKRISAEENDPDDENRGP
jgi:CHAD domain-containing protein